MPGKIKDWMNVLRILAITVIIDGREREAELLAFTEYAQGLAPLAGYDPPNADWLADWYGAQRPEIIAEIKGRGKNTVILKAFASVTDPALREAVFDAIIHIAVSDKDYHASESDYIRSAAAIWGFRPPFIKTGPTE
ncbi:TerB family tellurite resistance protein [Robiginitomaculum antarcticum]|uniref:TerB family tellurite resistance protein n=1 Tax=Robiginitomaculum antarcticum TaxID=437507 RepID=UPI00146167E4|nr:TerB family tellurite resistance protein [Robiginitomaculum antarcticum]